MGLRLNFKIKDTEKNLKLFLKYKKFESEQKTLKNNLKKVKKKVSK